MRAYSRNSEGRFVVRLPLEVPAGEISENRNLAVRMLFRMGRAVSNDVKSMYVDHHFLC